MREHYGRTGWTLERIGQKIKYSVASVYKLAKAMGLVAGKELGRSREHVQFLLQNKNKLSDAELADRLGHTIAEINRRWQVIKHTRPSSVEIEEQAHKEALIVEAEQINQALADWKPYLLHKPDEFINHYSRYV